MLIEPLRPEHWEDVARIYAEGIATGQATFETEVPTWEAWDAAHLAEHRFVAVRDGDVLGWAALSRSRSGVSMAVSPRAAST